MRLRSRKLVTHDLSQGVLDDQWRGRDPACGLVAIKLDNVYPTEVLPRLVALVLFGWTGMGSRILPIVPNDLSARRQKHMRRGKRATRLGRLKDRVVATLHIYYIPCVKHIIALVTTFARGAVSVALVPDDSYPAGFDAQSFDWDKPLAGKKALVTGGSRGIGASIARVLARDGAEVTVLDIPPMAEDLNKVAEEIGGQSLELDITADDAPRVIADAAKKMGGLDILVHNAGVTRDKMLGNMPEGHWDMVMNINIASQLRINEQLVADGAMGEGGRIVSISSIAGIAGNLGQTNYGTSKAAVIGMIDTYSEEYADKGITVNAVAPGFIETQMTAAIPFTIREAGRRMNAMSQGGQPVDVAETISFFASPASQGLTGNVVRVCGQMMLGA